MPLNAFLAVKDLLALALGLCWKVLDFQTACSQTSSFGMLELMYLGSVTSRAQWCVMCDEKLPRQSLLTSALMELQAPWCGVKSRHDGYWFLRKRVSELSLASTRLLAERLQEFWQVHRWYTCLVCTNLCRATRVYSLDVPRPRLSFSPVRRNVRWCNRTIVFPCLPFLWFVAFPVCLLRFGEQDGTPLSRSLLWKEAR